MTDKIEPGKHEPKGALTIRTLAMPADTNPAGDIFGGWVLSQMDLAGGALAARRCGGRCATVAITAMTFHEPIFVGDEVSCYAEIVKVGRTSMTLKVEAWAQRYLSDLMEKVTDADFVMVALDKRGKPKAVPT